MNFKFSIVCLFSLLFFAACDSLQPDTDEIICSTIFKSITIDVAGPPLSSHYTMHINTKKLVEDDSPKMGAPTYTVLNDRYKGQLINQQDSFQFVGMIKDSIVVSETFVIGANTCHIYYVSGKKQVKL